jgi:hypothetical protein
MINNYISIRSSIILINYYYNYYYELINYFHSNYYLLNIVGTY